LGLYDYHARYYDASIGRFISADVIVPNTSRLTPLTVGFHETMFIEQANGENAQLMQLGPVFRWSARQKQELGTTSGPLVPQNLNRYAYALNNPQTYTDPTGHEWIATEVDRATYTIAELEDLIRRLEEAELTLKIGGAAMTLLAAAIAIVAGPELISKLIALLTGLVGFAMLAWGEELGSLKGYFEKVLSEAKAAGLESIDLIRSYAYHKVGWTWIKVPALTSSITPTRGYFMTPLTFWLIGWDIQQQRGMPL
jgi:hypothetical protein